MYKSIFSIKSLAAVLMMSAAVVVSSCKKDKDEDKTVSVTPPTPTLSLTSAGQTEVKFKADGTADGNAAFTVATNQGSWDAVANKTWVTVSKTATGFTVSATSQPVDAVATVTVSASGAADIVINLTIKGLGVEINGVVWAPYNVNAVGAFAARPEAAGKFYQGNRKVAWAATGAVSNWDSSVPDGDSWTEANDPSPAGWRVPTREELNSLFDTEKVSHAWVTTPANGRLFTDKDTKATLFLPAAGYRSDSDGTLNEAGTYGYYWISTANGTSYAYYLYFYSGNASVHYSDSRYGLSVRSVAK